MRYVRRLLWIVSIASTVVLAVVGLGAWLISSEGAASWLVRSLESRSGGALSITEVSGTVAGGLSLGGIELDIDGDRIAIDVLQMDLDLAGFLARALVFESISIGRIDYSPAAEPREAESQPSAELPVLVLAREVSIDEIDIETGDQELVFGATTFEARYIDGRLEVSRLSTRLFGFEIEADVDVSLAAELDAYLCARGVLLDEPIDACVTVAGTLPALAVDADFRLPFEASAEGSVLLAEVPEADLSVDWQNAALGALDGLVSPEASIEIQGPFDRLQVVADGRAVYSDVPLGFRTSFFLMDTLITDAELSLTNGASELGATGSIDLAGPTAMLDLVGSRVNPALIDAAWPGELDFRGSLSVFAVEPLDVALADVTVGGEIRGYPVVATGTLRYSDAGLRLVDVDVTSRTDRIELDGVIGGDTDLSVEASVRDIGLLWPELTGELEASVLVQGSPEAPLLRGNAELAQFSFGEYSAQRIELSGGGGLEEQVALQVDIEAEGLQIGLLDADRLDAVIGGTLEEHELEMSMSAGEWDLRAAAGGGLVNARWRGAVDTLSIEPTALGSWRFDRPAEMEVGVDGVSVSRSCLRRDVSELCVEAELTGSIEDRVVVQASQFDLGVLAPFYPEEFSAAGIYEIDLTLIDLSGNPRGSLSLSSDDTSLLYAVSAQEQVDLSLDRVIMNAELIDRRLSMTGRLSSGGVGSVILDFEVADIEQEASRVDGFAEFEWNDVSPLSLLSPEVGAVTGHVNGELTFGGTLLEPTVSGNAEYEDGTIEVPVWGLTVEGIRAALASSDDRELAFSAAGNVADSRLEIDGAILLDAERGWPTELRLRGDSVKLVQLQEAEVVVSPDLEVVVEFPRIDVTGSVQIPSARISALGLPEQAIAPSSDVIVHGREAVPEERPLEVRAELLLQFGDDVRYRGVNLDAELSGEVLLDYLSGRPTTASGALSLGGRYDAYGNPLALERGQLVFAGPWDNPSLDVRAARTIGEITVGVQLSGTLQSPVSRIFSEPAMSEAEALSYLLLGQPLNSADGQDAVTLESAALAMGLRQAVPAIERFGETLGLDELTVRPTQDDAGALMAGKYLSPRLYVRYTYGLFNRIGGLLLRYRITDRFSVETQSGHHKSMDLLYTVEKD